MRRVSLRARGILQEYHRGSQRRKRGAPGTIPGGAGAPPPPNNQDLAAPGWSSKKNPFGAGEGGPWHTPRGRMRTWAEFAGRERSSGARVKVDRRPDGGGKSSEKAGILGTTSSRTAMIPCQSCSLTNHPRAPSGNGTDDFSAHNGACGRRGRASERPVWRSCENILVLAREFGSRGAPADDLEAGGGGGKRIGPAAELAVGSPRHRPDQRCR